MAQEFEIRSEGQSNEPMDLPLDLLDNPAIYDGDIPLWRRTVGFVKEYQSARPQKKENLVGGLARSIARDPAILVHFLNNFDLVAQLKPDVDVAGIQDQLITQTEQAVAFRPNLPTWTPDKIEQLVRLGLDNKGRMAEAVQRMEAALFNAPRTMEESIDLHYNAAWAMVASTQPEIREELVSILHYEKPWFSELSLPAFYFYIGSMGVTDDTHIKRLFSVCNARSAVANFSAMERDGRFPLNSLRIQSLEARLKSAPDKWALLVGPKVAAWFFNLERTYAKRVQTVLEAFDHDPISREYDEFISDYQAGKRTNLSEAVQSLLVMDKKLKELQWPYNLKHNPEEPLRKMVSKYFGPQVGRVVWEQRAINKDKLEIITKGPVQLTDEFNLMIAAEHLDSAEQRRLLVREVYNDLMSRYQNSLTEGGDQKNREIFQYANLFHLGYFGTFEHHKLVTYVILRKLPEEEIGKLSSILEFYRPLISPDQLRSAREQISSLRSDLRYKFTRSVGRRGYDLSVTDPALRSFGYETIIVRQINANETSVSVTIDGRTYKFVMDAEYRIKPGDDIKRFQNPQDQAWLELLTLSHLKKLVCIGEDDEELKAELLGGEKQLAGYRKQMVHKSEHLRHLQRGQKYSTSAFELCLKSHLPVKRLDLINRMRAERGWGGTTETGMWTYVSGVERDIDTQVAKPVKVAFKNASEDIRKVIDLEAITDEELDRLEKVILAELEAV